MRAFVNKYTTDNWVKDTAVGNDQGLKVHHDWGKKEMDSVFSLIFTVHMKDGCKGGSLIYASDPNIGTHFECDLKYEQKHNGIYGLPGGLVYHGVEKITQVHIPYIPSIPLIYPLYPYIPSIPSIPFYTKGGKYSVVFFVKTYHQNKDFLYKYFHQTSE